MEKLIVEEFVKERIKENEKLFDEKELCFIYENIALTKKVYLLGVKNAIG